MQKKIILKDKSLSKKFSLKIYKDKLINYYGLSNSRFFEESNNTPKTFKINTKYEIYRLNKYDQKEHQVKANYILKNEQLDFIVGGIGIYLNLNLIEVLLINWWKKKYIIQSKEIKTDIVKYIIGGILGFIGGVFSQKIMEYTSTNKKSNESQIETKIDANAIKIDKTFKESNYEVNLTNIDSVRKNLNGFWVSEKDTLQDKILWLSFEKSKNSSSWEVIPFNEEINKTKEIPISSCTTFVNLIKIKDSVQIQFISMNGQDTAKIQKLTKTKFKMDELTYLKHKGYDFLK